MPSKLVKAGIYKGPRDLKNIIENDNNSFQNKDKTPGVERAEIIQLLLVEVYSTPAY